MGGVTPSPENAHARRALLPSLLLAPQERRQAPHAPACGRPSLCAPGVAPLLEGAAAEAEADGPSRRLLHRHLEIVDQAAARHRVVGLHIELGAQSREALGVAARRDGGQHAARRPPPSTQQQHTWMEPTSLSCCAGPLYRTDSLSLPTWPGAGGGWAGRRSGRRRQRETCAPLPHRQALSRHRVACPQAAGA